ncbi:hypothetical protein FKZ69_11315 [Pseudomonas azotoformans]|nr:hypothetical protein FKZ69_11315 [Pseudomonas azotoformans]
MRNAVEHTDFDRQRDHNLYRIWNRLCSGSYFPPPLREKRIPKDNGKERTVLLGSQMRPARLCLIWAAKHLTKGSLPDTKSS